MTTPQRIQLSRKRGWRKPPGAVIVARPTIWGNPFKITDELDRAQAVDAFREYLATTADEPDYLRKGYPTDAQIRSHLAGRDLACWCPPDEPCHADVLLEHANGTARMTATTFDEDALVAAVDLVGRSGATDFEVGYLDDDVPVELARWWAKAQYRGARLSVDEHRGPVEAAEALARLVLRGGLCTHCGALIHVGGAPRSMRRKASVCAWKRDGRRWVRGCLDRVPEGHRKIKRVPR